MQVLLDSGGPGYLAVMLFVCSALFLFSGVYTILALVIELIRFS